MIWHSLSFYCHAIAYSKACACYGQANAILWPNCGAMVKLWLVMATVKLARVYMAKLAPLWPSLRLAYGDIKICLYVYLRLNHEL